jgi:hypothetical protein
LTVKGSLIFVNRFSKLNSLPLHARLISNYWNPTIVFRRNLAGAEIWQHPATGIQRHPVTVARAGRPDSSHGQKPAGFGQNGQDPVKSYWILPFIPPDLANMVEIRLDLAKMAGIQRSPAGIRQF